MKKKNGPVAPGRPAPGPGLALQSLLIAVLLLV
jgi:hypothetical protein